MRSYHQLARSTLVGIVLTVIFWILSQMFDIFFNNIGQPAEDSSKFIGIAVWATAWIRQSYSDIIRLAVSRP